MMVNLICVFIVRKTYILDILIYSMENTLKFFDKQLTAEDLIGLGGELIKMQKNLNKQTRPSNS